MGFVFITIAAIIAAFSVALGAFAAHGLQAQLSVASLEVFKTAVHYQFIHALALFALGILLLVMSGQTGTTSVGISGFYVAGIAWLIGILLFSGSLYGLTLTEWRWLGPVTPLGGLSFIIGWVSLAVASWRMAAQQAVTYSGQV